MIEQSPDILPETIKVALAVHRALDILSTSQAALSQAGAVRSLTVADAHGIIMTCNEQRRQMDEIEDAVAPQTVDPLFHTLRIALVDMADFVARSLRYENRGSCSGTFQPRRFRSAACL
jgi:hypothetical protein